MIDFWKSLIEHILSWPVAASFLGLVFRKPLTGLVERINTIKASGIELGVQAAKAQLVEKTLEVSETLKGEIISPSWQPEVTSTARLSGDELVAKRQAVIDYGKGIPLVEEEIQSIKSQLATLEMPLDSLDTGEILVRQLAVTQLMLQCERTHRLIFGSQIAALHLLNMQGPQPESTIRPIFEAARGKEPQFYGQYSFENWMKFLINEVTVRCDEDTYAITVYGQHYLSYIGLLVLAPKPH